MPRETIADLTIRDAYILAAMVMLQRTDWSKFGTTASAAIAVAQQAVELLADNLLKNRKG